MDAGLLCDDGKPRRQLRTKQYTYAVYLSDGQELLFDNISDPLQKKNLVTDPSFRDVAEKLRAQMHREMERIGDTFAPSSWYEKHWVENRRIKRIR